MVSQAQGEHPCDEESRGTCTRWIPGVPTHIERASERPLADPERRGRWPPVIALPIIGPPRWSASLELLLVLAAATVTGALTMRLLRLARRLRARSLHPDAPRCRPG